MLKKILFSLFIFLLLIVPAQNILAQDIGDVNVYFFWGDGCPHCAREKPFLEKLEQKYPEVKVYDYEIWRDAGNRDLMVEVAKKLNASVSGVPFTVVGEKYFIGYYNDATTGREIEEAVEYCLTNQCVEVFSQDNNPQEETISDTKIIDLPFLGEIDALNFSLPILTIVMGGLDGFNPCAMWVLLFLISLLLGMKDKRKMWILGTAFIVASASVYFVFMAAWLNLILFIGVVIWVRIIIGLVTLVGGVYNLKEYFTNHTATCKVTGSEKKQRVFEKLKDITQQRSFFLALGAIILLAFAVNLVELLCSAGLPAVYTQVLALSDLAKWQYYLYILLYIFVFMLDDLFIFFVAMTTLQMTGISAKYSRWSHLIGGILMLIIGLLLIFKPEWLMFG